ncbi:ABC transporter substrate-binding protein [Allocoleopsis franciscana]|uniref:ABC transporter substrate-binding protein n=1 Tax=Allocoleopsis franciscana TaxID=2886352 RepID=UPI0009D9A809|nr:ABC transporter substrate-binding protein [Allocoleopsis franciscana]
MLRGVAQAQNEFNQKQKGVRIKILIADDGNKSAHAKQIAKDLVKKKEILAVVGHFTSDSTLAPSKIYQQNQLLSISPTSAARQK